jgi:hypothetical protein
MKTGRDPGQTVDHINGIKLDNRWKNLRDATRAENCRNANKAPNSHGLKGVRKGSANRYEAQICFNYKKIYLGCFDSAEKAHEAYKEAAIKLHGKFAKFSN